MSVKVEIPALGESVTQAILVKWHKPDGATVAKDEALCELETDKANVDVPSPAAGVLRRLKEAGETVLIKEEIARIEAGSGTAAATPAPAAATPAKPAAPAPAPANAPAADELSPAVRRLVAENKLDPKSIRGTGPGGRLTTEDVHAHLAAAEQAPAEVPAPSKPAPVPAPASKAAPTQQPIDFDANGERRVVMSKIRKRIAERLLAAQQGAAILTTINQVDCTEIFQLRAKYKERFQEVHGVGLGLMSFFVRACCLALKEFPRVNAFIDGDDVIYHNFVHMGIAVSTDRGLTVPVLRNAQNLSFHAIESEIKRVAIAARDGKLGLDELSGGTFTITNGGVFGSLLSTPILNPPQSGILGMHTVEKRPMVVNDKIEIRQMMYIALSYDHRLVDGRESVSFLVRVKQYLEDPARLMLEI